MFDSVWKDAKYYIRSGNTVVRLILINCSIFIFLVILRIFTNGVEIEGGGNLYHYLLYDNLALADNWGHLVTHPWTILSHIFVHAGLWSLLWGMVIFYWFGNIVGDLLGDVRIIPLFILGGLFSAVIFMTSYTWFNDSGNVGITMGAWGGIMAIVMAAGLSSPDYNIRLVLIGNVNLKYVVLAILVLGGLIEMSESTAAGIVHFSGAFFGALYVVSLRQGYDLGAPIDSILKIVNGSRYHRAPKAQMRVAHKSNLIDRRTGPRKKINKEVTSDHQYKLDTILDKIKDSGFDSLSEEEKDFLYQASKK